MPLICTDTADNTYNCVVLSGARLILTPVPVGVYFSGHAEGAVAIAYESHLAEVRPARPSTLTPTFERVPLKAMISQLRR